MRSSFRKPDLLLHITFAVGWLGAVAAYLALALAGLHSSDASTVRGAYLAMDVVGWYVIVPFSFVGVAAGLVQALTTEWGLARHYWLLTKFVLTTVASIILLLHMPTVTRVAALARDNAFFSTDHSELRWRLVVTAAGGLLVLLTTTMLSVYKPWGKTKHGQQVQQAKVRRPATGRSSTT